MPATTSILMMLAEASGATACRMRRNGTSLLAANIRHHLEMEHCHCGPMCHGATASFSSQTTIRSSQETLRHSSTVVLHGSLGARLGKLRFMAETLPKSAIVVRKSCVMGKRV